MKIKSLLFTIALATAILCSGGIVSAQATDNSALIAQLQAQIATMMAQMQALQSQQSATPPADVLLPQTSLDWCHTFNSNLGFANSGSNDVLELHTALQKENISYGSDIGNTYFNDTAIAVKQFQNKYNILQTGYVGTITRAKLNSLYGCQEVIGGAVSGNVGVTNLSGTSTVGWGGSTCVRSSGDKECASVKGALCISATKYFGGMTIDVGCSWVSGGMNETGGAICASPIGIGVGWTPSCGSSSGTYTSGDVKCANIGKACSQSYNGEGYSWDCSSKSYGGGALCVAPANPSYTLTYSANGGVGAPVTESRVAGSVANLSATVPTRAGYTFAGWNTNSSGTGTTYSAGASYTMPATATTLYAKWTANTPNTCTSFTITNLSPIVCPASGFQTGTVVGSPSGCTGGNPPSPTSACTPLPYVVTYNGNGNTSGAVQYGTATYFYMGNVTVPGSGTLVKTGYTFAGWKERADGVGDLYVAGSTFTMPPNNVTLYAAWVPVSTVTYTVTYNGNGNTGGYPPASVTGQAGSVVNLGNSGALTKYGKTATGLINYTFGGWSLTPSGTALSSYTMPSSNVTLYAVWTDNSVPTACTYTTSDWTPTVCSSGITRTRTITASPAGCIGGTAPASTEICPVAQTFTISFNGNGQISGGVPASMTARAGLVVTLPGNTGNSSMGPLVKYTKTASGLTYYVFGGWSLTPSGTALSSFTMPSSNVTLYAVWTLPPVSFSGSNDAGLASIYDALAKIFAEVQEMFKK